MATKHYLAYLQDTIKRRWDAPALADLDNPTKYSYGELATQIARLHVTLEALGIKKGDKVAILLMNCLEWLPAYFGILKTGAVAVPLNYRYTAEEIIASTGIKTGENLLHIDAKKAEESVMSAFAFVDKVSVKKSFPTKIVVEITEAQNWFALNQSGKTVVISRGGRVLGEIPADGLVVVKGFEAESLDTGSKLSSTVDAKNKIIMETTLGGYSLKCVMLPELKLNMLQKNK